MREQVVDPVGKRGGESVPAPLADEQPPRPDRPEERADSGRGRFLREFRLQRVLDENGEADPAEVSLPDPVVRQLYRWMVLGRVLDERMVTLQRQGRIGFYIGAVGEEATVVGAAAGVEERDWIFPCYREHTAALMRGYSLTAFLCNLLGNAGDVNKGRQMPCHEAWRPGRYLSISSPIATQISQAVGAAWAARLKGDDMVALVYFGEGATSAHDFHTGLNFAAVHRVPSVLVCRNNGWAISVPREKQMASETVAQKALAYGMRAERVDGNDLLAVHAAVRRARARASAGEGPTLLECVTYRMEGHSTSDDPRAYRPESLLEPWRRRDPIERVRRYLVRRGALDEAGEATLRDDVREQILAALRQAEAEAPRPPLATLFEDVYAEPLRQQREQLEELEAARAADPRVSDPRYADA
ncbi:MAG TPA: thiamine pyrophosphate-dependent enzyme [Anaeromyxobacter sp.]|nr:thiamine pyrophosphate-dependent enzyme [Anaeromyxobacter sp.]